MKYHDWLQSVPKEIAGDPLWNIEAYRLALFLADLGWQDVTKLAKHKRTLDLSQQLYSAIGSVGANISEGYGRSSGRDRVRFYEYALGSGRETRGWYYCARHVLGEKVVAHRVSLLTQIIRLLLTMIPDQRSVAIHECGSSYGTGFGCASEEAADCEQLKVLLEDVPVP